MTFCLAFASRYVALVSADTRTCWHVADGDHDPTAGWTKLEKLASA